MREFKYKIEQIVTDKVAADKISKVIDESARQYPCLSCPSKGDCAIFKWFKKWFGPQE